MMTSSNGSIFRVTGPLCGEFTGPGEFPAQRPVTRRFDVFFDLRVNKRLSKQPRGWWLETPSLSLWRHRNDGMDITNAGDASSSNQIIRNNIEGHFIADWKDKMQDTAQFPILRTYKLFKQTFKCESYIHLIKIISIELHLLNFELVVTI